MNPRLKTIRKNSHNSDVYSVYVYGYAESPQKHKNTYRSDDNVGFFVKKPQGAYYDWQRRGNSEIVLSTTLDKCNFEYDRNVKYCKITDIYESEAELYDIEVEEDHSYIVDGIVSHNTIMSAGDRRGAMMATLRCDHPDIVKFITAKHDPAALRMFNVSVLITDDFMQAKDNDGMWALGHWEPPFDESKIKGTQTRYKDEKAAIWYVYEYISARKLWEMIMDSTYIYAEPGVIFIDRINKLHNLYYYENVNCA